MKTGWSLREILELEYSVFIEYHLAHMEPPRVKPSKEEIEKKLEALKRINYSLNDEDE
ncbi:hypothetical protein [Methanothermobacter sp. K4]|jgi:hypothetical protein|uniref:hypothetical protein n=1 Tax=Methanothermobacter sp. K4 TaxID=2913262 RepID=UPI001EDA28EA|nr:hypothetical protein [Methanothermobacter sp. K4]MCG2827740.1 hypothetical protein [Methanothermobacter sp. K4]MCQ8904377.1 hypothetical protein [Methanothermobacter sp.]NLU04893.1 hypothetical protein [Methanothermobacter sp.]